MLSVFSRGMLASNQTRRAQARYAYGRRCSQSSNRNNFRGPDLTDDMRQACSMLSVFSRGMLASGKTMGARMLNAPADAASHSQATATAFGPGSR